jgi:hypothetical protein
LCTVSNETENDAVNFADGTLICSCAWKLGGKA